MAYRFPPCVQVVVSIHQNAKGDPAGYLDLWTDCVSESQEALLVVNGEVRDTQLAAAKVPNNVFVVRTFNEQ